MTVLFQAALLAYMLMHFTSCSESLTQIRDCIGQPSSKDDTRYKYYYVTLYGNDKCDDQSMIAWLLLICKETLEF